MTATTFILVASLLAASVLLLRKRDFWPMVLNLVLIAGGTAGAVWLLANPDRATASAETLNLPWWQVLAFLALQGVLLLGYSIARHLTGPYSVYAGAAQSGEAFLATVRSLRDAKRQANEQSGYVKNLRGDVIYDARPGLHLQTAGAETKPTRQ